MEFLRVVAVNGNRLCAKSRMASLERRARLTRGNDPEDRNVLSARARLRSGALSVVIPKEAPKFPLSTSVLEGKAENRRRRLPIVEDTSATANGTFCRKNRVVKPTESTSLYYLRTFMRSDKCVYCTERHNRVAVSKSEVKYWPRINPEICENNRWKLLFVRYCLS